MKKNQIQYNCIFCGNKVDEEGRIQFNNEGQVIGCCKHCLDYCKLFSRDGRKIKYD